MNIVLMILGALMGASTMYLMDPIGGRHRRALMRDKLAHTEDLKNRAAGVAHETKDMVQQRFKDEPVPDHALEGHIRAEIVRLISYSGSVRVAVCEGRVILTGPILTDEVPGLLSVIRHIPGVKEVVNELRIYERSGDIPGRAE
jgi:hypothetical protein